MGSIPGTSRTVLFPTARLVRQSSLPRRSDVGKKLRAVPFWFSANPQAPPPPTRNRVIIYGQMTRNQDRAPTVNARIVLIFGLTVLTGAYRSSN
jgi:hypothetical protein